MFKQLLTPVGDSLGLSFVVAALPIVVVLVGLGVLRRPAWQASLAGLIVAFLIAVYVWSLPVELAARSVANGMVFAVWPVMWIVFNAMLLYNVSVASGRFDAFRRWTLEHLPNDRRVVLVAIGFCFGALLEGVAGFGVPVAITSSLLILVGFPPLEALVFVLIFNTAPVAFGALGAPVTVLGAVTGLPAATLGAMIGRQLPFMALMLPFYVMFVYGGLRSVKALWPVLLVAGGSFAVSQFVASNYIDYSLTDVLASMGSLIVTLGFLMVWKPAPDPEFAIARNVGKSDQVASIEDYSNSLHEKENFKNIRNGLFSFDGRANRGQYWGIIFGITAIDILFYVVFVFSFSTPADSILRVLSVIVIALLPVSIWIRAATCVKRCHDIGINGWTTILVLIPVINLIFLVVIGCFGSEQGTNRFGQQSKFGQAEVSLWEGWIPWISVSAVVIAWTTFSVFKIDQQAVEWPGLHKAISITLYGDKPYAAVWTFQPLASGTGILVAAIITAALCGLAPGRFFEAVGKTLSQIWLAVITVCFIVGLAYLMNYSGLAYTLGKGVASVGALFVILSPFLGWVAVFLSGSDTSGNALFGNLQVVAAKQLNLSPVLFAAANSSGGVMGKMISPQNIATGVSVTSLKGREGEVFARTFPHSVILTLIFGLLVAAQQYLFPWMIPG